MKRETLSPSSAEWNYECTVAQDFALRSDVGYPQNRFLVDPRNVLFDGKLLLILQHKDKEYTLNSDWIMFIL